MNRASCMNQASVFEWHKRFKGGRESVRDDERCGKSKEVNTGVQEEIPSEEASTLKIGSVAFPPEQYTSPQLHPYHRLWASTQFLSLPIVQTLLPVIFGYSLISEAVVI